MRTRRFLISLAVVFIVLQVSIVLFFVVFDLSRGEVSIARAIGGWLYFVGTAMVVLPLLLIVLGVWLGLTALVYLIWNWRATHQKTQG